MKERKSKRNVSHPEDPEKEMEEFFDEVERKVAMEILKEEDYLPELPALEEALKEMEEKKEDRKSKDN